MCQDTVDVTVIKAEWFLTLHSVYTLIGEMHV